MFLPNLRVFGLMLAAVFSLGAGTGLAQDLKPLPELTQGFDLAAYAAGTDTIKKEFADFPTLNFEVALPKTWTERSTLGHTYGEMVRYDGPPVGDVRPYFSLKRLQLKRENSARLELVAYMLKQGYVLRSLDVKDDRNVEALYVVVNEKGDSFAVRTVMRIVGPDMLLAEYALPVDAFDRMIDQQTFAIQSFKFLTDSDATIEKRIERTYYKAVRLYYPASWVFEGEQTPADNTVIIRLANPGEAGQEAGRMTITVVGPRSLKDAGDKRGYPVDVPGMLKEIRKRYEDRGYIFGDTLESRKPDLNLPAALSLMDVYALRKRVSQYDSDGKEPVTNELWLAVFRGHGDEAQTYVAELFTPARSMDIYLWSINTRAYEIVLKSIQ